MLSLPFIEGGGAVIFKAARSWLVAGWSTSSGTVRTKSMTFGYDMAGVGVAAFCFNIAGGSTAGGGTVSFLVGMSAWIIPSNFLSAS